MNQKIRFLKSRAKYQIGFGNNGPLRKNLIYWAYHLYCRRHCSVNSKIDDKIKVSYKKHGYYLLAPTADSLSTLESLPPNYCEDRLNDTVWLHKYPFMKHYFFDENEFGVVSRLLDKETRNIIRSLYGCNFLVLSALTYRYVPPSDRFVPRSTWLWHSDDHPDCLIKLFYYLNDTSRKNSALQVHPLSHSMKIKKAGFYDRRNVPAGLRVQLDDEAEFHNLEGKRGTRIFFNDNIIHRAVVAEEARRDVIVFEIIPSKYDRIRYKGFKFKYWENPFLL
jgi:hypothetical protein